MRQIKYIVIHCAATRPSADIGAREIDGWHKAQGWLGIGYHYVIRRNGEIENGRPDEQPGAHVSGYNSNSIGVCLVGGLDERGKPSGDHYAPEQWESLAELVRRLIEQYPLADIRGHRDFPNVKKDCPCFDVKHWLLRAGIN